MEIFKNEANRYFRELRGNDKRILGARRPQPLLLVHFTSIKNAEEIISSGTVKIKKKPYVALTALHPFEFNRVASKNRPIGFAFFKKDILKDYPVLTPFAYTEKVKDIIPELDNGSLGKRFKEIIKIENTHTQPALSFTDYFEYRSLEELSLFKCCLLFRNKKEPSLSSIEKLDKLAIFRIPYQPHWFTNYFLQVQKWMYSKEGNYVNFFDTNSIGINTTELLKKLRILI